MSCEQAGARCGGQPGCGAFLRGTLGITAWTCVCVCARPEALCTTRACVSIGFWEASPTGTVRLSPRVLVHAGGWGAGPRGGVSVGAVWGGS